MMAYENKVYSESQSDPSIEKLYEALNDLIEEYRI